MAQEKAVLAVLTAARPVFRHAHDKVAYVLHACLLVKGYTLVALGPHATSFDQVEAKTEEVSSDGWNAQEEFHFCYIPEAEDKVRVILKGLALGPNLCVSATSRSNDAKKEEELLTTEIMVDNFTQEGTGAYKSQYTNLSGLLKQIDEFESKLSKQFKPPEASPSASSVQADKGVSRLRARDYDDVHPDNVMPAYGGMDQPFPAHPQVPYVGADDLVPPGIRPPGMTPAFGMGTPWGLTGPMRGSQVGPHDPMFDPRARFGQPRNTLPPGARWDPISPPGMKGFHPDDFVHQSGRVHPDIGPPPGRDDHMDHMFG